METTKRPPGDPSGDRQATRGDQHETTRPPGQCQYAFPKYGCVSPSTGESTAELHFPQSRREEEPVVWEAGRMFVSQLTALAITFHSSGQKS